MKTIRELSRRELMTLKEIGMRGQTNDQEVARRFTDDGIIADFQNGDLCLTKKGRSLLVRGSPLLWEAAA